MVRRSLLSQVVDPVAVHSDFFVYNLIKHDAILGIATLLEERLV